MRRFLCYLLALALFCGIGAVGVSAADAEEVEEVVATALGTDDNRFAVNNPWDTNPWWHWDHNDTYWKDTLERFAKLFGNPAWWVLVHILFGWLWMPWVGLTKPAILEY